MILQRYCPFWKDLFLLVLILMQQRQYVSSQAIYLYRNLCNYDYLRYIFRNLCRKSIDIKYINLITPLKLSIIVRFLLHGVICEMNHFILQIFKRVGHRGGSDVPLFEPIPFEDSVLRCREHETSYIEFSVEIQQWVMDV